MKCCFRWSVETFHDVTLIEGSKPQATWCNEVNWIRRNVKNNAFNVPQYEKTPICGDCVRVLFGKLKLGILVSGRVSANIVLLEMGFSSIHRWRPTMTLRLTCAIHSQWPQLKCVCFTYTQWGQVDYDKNFLFYMTTKMPNPHYFPEVCIKAGVADCGCRHVIHMDVLGANLRYRNGSWRNLSLCMPLGCFECHSEQDVWHCLTIIFCKRHR